MKITEQLKKIIRQSQYVILRNEGIGYAKFTFVTISDNETNAVRLTRWCESIQGIKTAGLDDGPYWYDEDDLKDFEFVTAYTEIEPYEVGQKVRVREDAQEICERWELDWHKIKEKMIGDICEIDDLDGSYYAVWSQDGKDCFYLPHAALEPVLEEEEITELTLEDIAKLAGKDVSKIKIVK